MTYFTMDSFGSNCPTNWEQIASVLNSRLENRIDEEHLDDPDDIREAADSIWEDWCASDEPAAEMPINLFDALGNRQNGLCESAYGAEAVDFSREDNVLKLERQPDTIAADLPEYLLTLYVDNGDCGPEEKVLVYEATLISGEQVTYYIPDSWE